jgi:membrane fusion protein (multidrug efflux system)
LAALAGCSKPAAPAPGTPEAGYVVIRAQAQPLTTELPGRTSPTAISEVRPQVSGIIQARQFVEGANVRKGQLLYRIDPAPYRAAVNQAKAQLANAEANLGTVKLKAERYADLVKIKAVSQQDYDDAQAVYHQAEATVQQAKAALETAQINLGYTDIAAPISGRIGLSALTQGALVTAGQATALTSIQTLDPIYVDVTQSSADLLRLERDVRAGLARKDGPLTAKVRLTLEDGSAYPLEGRLQFTDVTVDPSSGTVTLRVEFPNPQGVLLPGMFVRAVITQAVAPNAILVPQQGVTRTPKGEATVMLVGAGDKAEVRSVELGQAVGPNWLVTKGLQPGDRVITEGLQKIQPDTAVRPVPAGSPPQSPASRPPKAAPAPGAGRP